MPYKDRWYFDPQVNMKIDSIKIELCDLIRRSAERQGFDAQRMAYHMRTTTSNVSLVRNARVGKLTLSQLFRYLANLEPQFKILIAI